MYTTNCLHIWVSIVRAQAYLKALALGQDVAIFRWAWAKLTGPEGGLGMTVLKVVWTWIGQKVENCQAWARYSREEPSSCWAQAWNCRNCSYYGQAWARGGRLRIDLPRHPYMPKFHWRGLYRISCIIFFIYYCEEILMCSSFWLQLLLFSILYKRP